MMLHQLFDLRLNAYFGAQKRMTQGDACAENRDLYLAGKIAIGWKRIEQALAPGVPTRKTKPPDGLVEALVGLGYKQREAKRLAGTIDGGTIEDAIRKIHEQAAVV